MTQPYAPPVRRLTRAADDRIVGGVCGGLARYFNVDATLVRVLTVVLVVVGFCTPLLAYLIAWVLMPKA